VKPGKRPDLSAPISASGGVNIGALLVDETGEALFDAGITAAASVDLADLRYICSEVANRALTDPERAAAVSG